MSEASRSFWENLFFSPDERRLRAGWRIVGTLFLLITYASLFSILYILIGRGEDQPAAFFNAYNGFVVFLIVTAGIFTGRRLLDRRSITSLGLRLNGRAAADLLVGILIAGLIMGTIYLIESAAGWLHFNGFAWQTNSWNQITYGAGLFLIAYIFVGWYEELIMRGYLLQNLADGLNLAWAVIISSVVFAAGHLGNPNASWVAVLGLILAGLFLAFGYLRTWQLWLPVGIHIGWNFFEGTVFGFAVSGTSSYRLIQQTVNGPGIMTGGAFGPEAGLILVPALILGTILIYFYTKNRIQDTGEQKEP